MASPVAERCILLLTALAFCLSPATCGLLRRDADAQCASDAVLSTFKAQSNVHSFCSTYLPSMLASVTALSVGPPPAGQVWVKRSIRLVTDVKKITTVVVANTTVTAQQTSQPTLDFTVIADYETITTTTIPCAETAVPAVAGVPALPTAGLPVGHRQVRGRDVDDVAAAASATSILLPAYAASLKPSQISSACLCLNSVPPAPTSLQLATVTSYANVLTKTVVNFGDVPVVNYITFGATRKLIVTECA